MREEIEQIWEDFQKELPKVNQPEDIEGLRSKYLGRKARLAGILRNLSSLPFDQRKEAGRFANQIKIQIEDSLNQKLDKLRKSLEIKLGEEKIDISLPGKPFSPGRRHIITQAIETILDIFTRLGFVIVEGPEVETDYYNFQALNFPVDHPSRDMQSTLYITDKVLLRTQTSPVQIRIMEKYKPPIAIVAPGKVYRHDLDVSHLPMFYQIEGLLVDEGIKFSDLKSILGIFVQKFFGEGTQLRFRPSFFPFTEPSAEVDIACVCCQGKGCRVCKQKGWVEILGAGMVHPAVFGAVGYDSEKYTGYAFGMGIERITMLKYGIDDIRLFYENDLRFLQQF